MPSPGDQAFQATVKLKINGYDSAFLGPRVYWERLSEGKGAGKGRERGSPDITGAVLFLKPDLGLVAQTSSLWAMMWQTSSLGLPKCLLDRFL